MTVRLAQDLGMPLISEYSRRFGVYDQLMPLLSMALGAGETTLLRLTTAYCVFANGGKQVQASMIDRIQDRYGKTIWRHDNRECPGCDAQEYRGQPEPGLTDSRKQVVDPHTAYQVTSMLEGVVKRGTGYRVSKVGKPLAGKTGTTNDEKDAWFVGFSPDLVAGVFVGFDNPRAMGKGETGGGVAAPIFRDFMRWALEDKPATPFRVPPGVKLVRIDAKTGMRAQQGSEKTILEAYKPNEDPPDPFSYVTYPGADVQPQQQQPDGSGVSFGGGYSRQPQAGGLY
jgi:penicillin-binding protein 1A